MSKSYASDIESWLRANKFRNIARLLSRFGKYKGHPINVIETRLKVVVEERRGLAHDDASIAQMINEEWLHK